MNIFEALADKYQIQNLLKKKGEATRKRILDRASPRPPSRAASVGPVLGSGVRTNGKMAGVNRERERRMVMGALDFEPGKRRAEGEDYAALQRIRERQLIAETERSRPAVKEARW
jgi:hypothetical protein